MALDSNSALGQAETANEKLAEYFNDLYKYLRDTTGTVLPPDFVTVAETLDYSELHRMTYVRAEDSASYENGAAIENTHQMIAFVREYNMANKRKSDFYVDASAEANRESEYYSNMKVFWVSMLRGIYVEGGTS
jgi:hypothetical protein